MKTITSFEVAERFGKKHKHILDIINQITDKDYTSKLLFSQATRTTCQNKSHTIYTMQVAGFCLLTDAPSFSRGKKAHIKSSIMKDFGERFAIVGSARNRGEDDFHSMLRRFIAVPILREHKISKYLVDFYIPEYRLIIEYDEKYHKAEKRAALDIKRERKVLAAFSELHGNNAKIVRVESGREIEGLAEISKLIQGREQ